MYYSKGQKISIFHFQRVFHFVFNDAFKSCILKVVFHCQNIPKLKKYEIDSIFVVWRFQKWMIEFPEDF